MSINPLTSATRLRSTRAAFAPLSGLSATKGSLKSSSSSSAHATARWAIATFLAACWAFALGPALAGTSSSSSSSSGSASNGLAVALIPLRAASLAARNLIEGEPCSRKAALAGFMDDSDLFPLVAGGPGSLSSSFSSSGRSSSSSGRSSSLLRSSSDTFSD